MGGYDQQLLELRQQAKRAKKIRELLALMETQYRSLEYDMTRKRRKQRAEQDDVDRMKNGVTGFFSRLTGSYRTEMNREVEECLAASMEYEDAVQAFRKLCDQRDAYQAELEELLPFETAYQTRIRSLSEELKVSGTPEGTRLIVLEEAQQESETRAAAIKWALNECDYLMGRVRGEMFDAAQRERAENREPLYFGRVQSSGGRYSQHNMARRHEQKLMENASLRELELQFRRLLGKIEERGIRLPDEHIMSGCSAAELNVHLLHTVDDLKRQKTETAAQLESLAQRVEDFLVGELSE